MSDSLENKFRLMTMLPFDKRLKRKHWAVYGFMLDWYHRKYGNALASVRHIVATLKERDPDGIGFFVGDVHSALTDLVTWGYLEQEKGTGRRASRYIPMWSKFASVRETPNTTEIDLAFGEFQNTDVRETPNTTDASVRETPNEDPSTGPGHKTGGHVVGDMFEAAPTAPPGSGLDGRPGAGTASGGFGEFWSTWPRKHGKKKAEAEWKRVDADLRDKVIATAALWAGHYATHGVDKKWIPEPANWLKGERWDEDLPIIHIDAKGAAIAKAKANAKPTPTPDNDNEADGSEDGWKHGPMICDVGPFSPFGTFNATITGSTVEHVDEETEKVVVDLSWGNPAYGPDAQHTFFFKHPDRKVQMRGRIFLSRLAQILGTEVTDTEQLHGLRVTCKINERLAISYSEAA